VRRRAPLAAALALGVLVAAGCGRALPEDTEEPVPAGGDATGAFGDGSGGGAAIEVSGWTGGQRFVRAAARGFAAEEPGARVRVGASPVAAAVGRLCSGRLSVAVADRPLSQAERKACAGAVELKVGTRGRSPLYLHTTTGVLTKSFETESFVTYAVEQSEELASEAGVRPLTLVEQDDVRSALDDAVAGLG
jgi:ABC-type phosphate transport system substrate-binding protein